jgi:hypothetical protein
LLDHRRGGVLLELRDAQVGVAGLHHLGLDALHLDDFARQLDHDRLRLPLAHDREDDVGARLAAHALDRVVEAHALDRGVVQLDDQVARQHTGAEGRSILDRRDHLDEAVFHADLDAETAEFALGADLEVLEGLGVEIGGVRIQPGEHAADRVGDQLLVLHRLDVALLDRVEDVGIGAQLVDRQRQGRAAVGVGGEIEADHDPGHHAGHDEAELFQLAAAHENSSSAPTAPVGRPV